METFNHSDANQILSMPIYSEVLEDEYVWKLTQYGEYSVKLAHYFITEQLVDNRDLQMNGNWTKLWGLRIPQKVTVFLWCAVRGCLPIRQQLQSRGVNCLDSSL